MYLLVDTWESWKDICTTVHTIDLREGAWWLGSRTWRGKRLSVYSTPWTVASRAPLSMGFSRQGYCRGLPEVKGILMLFEWFISPDVMLTLQDLLLNTNGCISRVKNTIFETIVFIHLQPHLSCLSPDHRLHAGLLTLKVL